MALVNGASSPSAVNFTDGVSTKMNHFLSSDAVEFVPSWKAPAINGSAPMVGITWKAWQQQSSDTCAVNLDDFTDESDSEDDNSSTNVPSLTNNTSNSQADEKVAETCKETPAVLEAAFEPDAETTPDEPLAEDVRTARRPWRMACALPPLSGDDLSLRRGITWHSTPPRRPPWKRPCGAGDSVEALETKEAPAPLFKAGPAGCELRNTCEEKEARSPVSQSTRLARVFQWARIDSNACSEGEPECECEEEPEATPQLETVAQDSVPPLAWRVLNLQEMLKWRAAVTQSTDEAPASRLTTCEVMAPAAKRADKDVGGPLESWRAGPKSWRAMAASPTKVENTKVENLEVSDNSWAARQRARRAAAAGAASDPDAEVSRTVKSILNKLTVDNFPRLYQQLVDCGFSTHNHVEIFVKEIFEKATTQHHFIDMYADICVLLQEHFVNSSAGDDEPSLGVKRLLLNACQASFQRNREPPAGLQLLPEEERTSAEVRYKTKMLGTVRLLGALLAKRMIASRILVSVLAELLGSHTAEDLEAAAALLTAAGATFDDPEWVHYAALDAVFAQIKDTVNRKTCKPRVRCLLKDVLELRARGWEDSRPKKIEAPTTLKEQARLVQESDRGRW